MSCKDKGVVYLQIVAWKAHGVSHGVASEYF